MSRVVPVAGRALSRGAMIICLLGAAISPGVAAAGAQAPGNGTLAGVVEDSLGAGVADVHLTVIGVPVLAKSGPDGGFRFAAVPAGARRLVARRIGYRPESLTVSVAPAALTRVTVRLSLMVQRVDPVLVSAPRAQYTGRLRAFH